MSDKISGGAARHEVWQHTIDAGSEDEAHDLMAGAFADEPVYGEAWQVLTAEEIEPGTYAVTTLHFWRTTEDPS